MYKHNTEFIVGLCLKRGGNGSERTQKEYELYQYIFLNTLKIFKIKALC